MSSDVAPLVTLKNYVANRKKNVPGQISRGLESFTIRLCLSEQVSQILCIYLFKLHSGQLCNRKKDVK